MWPAEVKYRGKPMNVVMSFASGREMENICSWADFESSMPSHMTQDQGDILEYASLLGGMFRVYESNNRFAGSANRLEHIVREYPRGDVLFALVMRVADSGSGGDCAPFASGEILGFSAMRRTWKNTVKLEFLAVNPFHLGLGLRMRGVGSALLAMSACVSATLSAPMFWGESSDTSLGFYTRRKFHALEDIVYLDSAGIAGFVEDTLRRSPWYSQKI